MGNGEALNAAFRRLALVEVGMEIACCDCRLLGVYEHICEDSVFGQVPEAPGTHYVVLCYEVSLATAIGADFPLEQHSSYCWFDQASVVAADDVHANTKAYIKDL